MHAGFDEMLSAINGGFCSIFPLFWIYAGLLLTFVLQRIFLLSCDGILMN